MVEQTEQIRESAPSQFLSSAVSACSQSRNPLAILEEKPEPKPEDAKYGYTRANLLKMWQDAYDGAMNGFKPSYAAAVTAVTRIAQICEFLGKDEGDLPRDFNIQIIQFAGAPPVAKQIQSQVMQ